ncbi:tyrosine-type recombinase/integrase [Oceanobacillus sp. 1P07AA]|uniref:tyrosine-type recombinase/integrase n=1 Tax=Oceanobacillus sp. 1P07AA TaxID=3132293 RepID=UPI0039A430F2
MLARKRSKLYIYITFHLHITVYFRRCLSHREKETCVYSEEVKLKVLCKQSELPILSPHALRYSHAVHLLESDATIKYVLKRLGHASIKTNCRYLSTHH